MRYHREFIRGSGDANDDVTLALANKWLSETDANLNELLLDVCDVLEAHDPAGARRYFEFWSTL